MLLGQEERKQAQQIRELLASVTDAGSSTIIIRFAGSMIGLARL